MCCCPDEIELASYFKFLFVGIEINVMGLLRKLTQNLPIGIKLYRTKIFK